MTINTNFSDEEYKKIVTLLNTLGVHAESLKKSHLLRRIDFRMKSTKCNTFQEYYNYVLQNQNEKSELKLAFSINVTHFFRDLDIFEYIKNRIIPKLLKSVSVNTQLKFWSAGCADGAEPYSLAILLEQLNISPAKAHIIATDYNIKLLSQAKIGFYSADYLKETPLNIQQKYFIHHSNNSIEIKPFIKNYVEFRSHNLLTTNHIPPESNFDAIICRNVLIYFTREQQIDIFNDFYNTLNPGGFLVIGSTETIPHSIEGKFAIVDNNHFIATKI